MPRERKKHTPNIILMENQKRKDFELAISTKTVEQLYLLLMHIKARRDIKASNLSGGDHLPPKYI